MIKGHAKFSSFASFSARTSALSCGFEGGYGRQDRSEVPARLIACPVNPSPQEPGGPGRIRSRTFGPNFATCWSSIPGSKPRPSSRIFSAGSRAGFPTASSAPCSGRSRPGKPSRVRPRRCSSIKSTRPAQLAPPTSRHMNDLHITLAGQPFDHLVYHFVLTYSNWETGTVCFSESFESLSQGLQNALWELGGVPQMHRTDRLTAAVNNLGDRDLFQQRYRALLAHYGLTPQAIKPARPTRTEMPSRAITDSNKRSIRPSCCAAAATSTTERPTSSSSASSSPSGIAAVPSGSPRNDRY